MNLPDATNRVPEHWTLAEADAAIPELQTLFEALRPRLRDIHRAVREGRAQEARDAMMAMEARIDPYAERGILIRDPASGIVDFPSMMGDQEVLLCWRMGEPAVRHWHSLDVGYAGRRPIPDVQIADQA